MRTAAWSLAFLAGGAIAAPHGIEYGPEKYPEESASTSCTESTSTLSTSTTSSSTTATIPAYPESYSSETSSSTSASTTATEPEYPHSWSHSWSKKTTSTSSASTTASVPEYSHSWSHPSNSSTKSWGPGAPGYSKPSWKPSSPMESKPSSSAPVYPSEYETTVTQITTQYTTYCPTSAVTTIESGTAKITSYISIPVVSPVTSVYTTAWPATSTEVHDDTIITKTYEKTSTVTTTWTSTVTGGAGGYGSGSDSGSGSGSGSEGGDKGADGYGSGSGASATGGNGSPAGYGGSVSWVTIPWGTTMWSYTVPATPTSTSSVEPIHTHHPDGYGSPTETAPGYPTGSGYPSGTGALPSYGGGNGSYPGGPTGTGSWPSKPTETKACIPCEGQPGKDPNSYCGYTIHNNYYEVMPITCRTVEYNFEITNTTVAPDGVERLGLLVNGQMPGPKIEANWGDTIIVHLTNSMQDNGTSIHFHGMRQNYTNEMDGVPSITQCALAPGQSMTYTFKATNYGSSWYHSHFSLQTYSGVFGPLVIHGPAAAEYDEDLGPVLVQDWSHHTADSMYDAAQTVGTFPEHGPRTLDTGLINGMNIWGTDGAANATGKRFTMRVVKGKTYRIRLVNTAIQSTFKFYIDGHKFKVIANDFVPIVPYETNIVNINIGQRYDLIFTADQPIGNYWMRADNQNACATITHATNIKGVISYWGAEWATPTSTAYNYTGECVDEPLASLVPIVPLNAGAQDEEIEKTVVVGGNGGSPNLYKWSLSGTTFQSQYGNPSLYQINKNGSVPDYSGNLAIEVQNLKEWVYVIIDSPIPFPHPIHLHGHDVLVLAQGTGLYSSDVVLNTVNPPRRDVVLMPWDPAAGLGGHLVLAFETDNPGAWLMHCHVGWHTSMGFALQIIENIDGIKKTVGHPEQLEDTCSSWNHFSQATGEHVYDSGV